MSAPVTLERRLGRAPSHALFAVAVAVVVAFAACACACAARSRPEIAAPRAGATTLDGMFEVRDGLAMHLHCYGRGSPTVILDAGFGVSGTGWQHTQRAMAETTRVCAYDRLGAGQRYGAAAAHVPAAHERAAHAARAGGRRGSYVLVAHSLAGLRS